MWLLHVKIFNHKFPLSPSCLSLCSTCYTCSLRGIRTVLSYKKLQNVNVGLQRKAEEATGTTRCTSILTFPCRRSSKTNPSKSYIKKSGLFLQRRKFDTLQLSTETLNKFHLHGIVSSHLLLIPNLLSSLPWL